MPPHSGFAQAQRVTEFAHAWREMVGPVEGHHEGQCLLTVVGIWPVGRAAAGPRLALLRHTHQYDDRATIQGGMKATVRSGSGACVRTPCGRWGSVRPAAGAPLLAELCAEPPLFATRRTLKCPRLRITEMRLEASGGLQPGAATPAASLGLPTSAWPSRLGPPDRSAPPAPKGAAIRSRQQLPLTQAAYVSSPEAYLIWPWR
jgi:hypothetical protein